MGGFHAGRVRPRLRPESCPASGATGYTSIANGANKMNLCQLLR